MASFVNPPKVVVRKRVFSAFSSAWNEIENRKLKKNYEEKWKQKDQRLTLILSHVNGTFLILDPRIGPQAFRQKHCTLRFYFIF
jgi:hypothetical protein